MTMTVRESFERGTEAFNAHDIVGFAEVLADDAVFEAPGGMRGEGKAACIEFYGSWLSAFPDAHVDAHRVHIIDDIAVEEATLPAHTWASSTARWATFRRLAAPSGSVISKCSVSGTAKQSHST